MRVPRIYTDQALTANSECELEEAPSHHVLKVLRMQTGRKLIIFNGQGGEFDAKIIATNKRQARLALGELRTLETESPLHTQLAIGLSRGERFDLVLQKATELGVSSITPLFTEHCEVKLSGERLEKKTLSWKKTLIAACEQCGRQQVPTLNPALSFMDFIQQKPKGLGLVLHHRHTQSLQQLKLKHAGINSVSLLIGPEGGLSNIEIDCALSNAYSALRLGPRILRTETAPLAVLSLLQYEWGDWQ